MAGAPALANISDPSTCDVSLGNAGRLFCVRFAGLTVPVVQCVAVKHGRGRRPWMTEFAAKYCGEIFQGCIEHPSGKSVFLVFTGLGFRRELLCVSDGGRQGTPLLDFVEVIGFME